MINLIHRNKQRIRQKRNRRNMLPTKEQDKNSEKERNEMKISNLADKKFKVIIIKMVTKLGRRTEKQSVEELQQRDKKKNKKESIRAEEHHH